MFASYDHNYVDLDSRNPSMNSRMESSMTIPESLALSGYLYKKSTSGEWQKRFFEVNGSYLTYYKTNKMAKLLAAINIPQVGKIRYVGTETDALGTGHVFQLDLKDRQYFLRCETQNEAKRWVDMLCTLRDSSSSSIRTTNPLNTVYSPTSTPSSINNSSISVGIEPKAIVQKSNRGYCGSCCAKS